MFKEPNYSGTLIEDELFQKIPKQSYEKFRLEDERYISFKESMKLVKKCQPFEDPSDPDPRFANDLHATVAESLNLENYDELKFFTAVGSHLDHFHGIDAFFIYNFNGKEIIVALDVTLNTKKGDYDDITKNKIVFLMPNEGLDPKIKEDKKDYYAKIKDISDRIINIINLKKGEYNKYVN